MKPKHLTLKILLARRDVRQIESRLETGLESWSDPIIRQDFRDSIRRQDRLTKRLALILRDGTISDRMSAVRGLAKIGCGISRAALKRSVEHDESKAVKMFAAMVLSSLEKGEPQESAA